MHITVPVDTALVPDLSRTPCGRLAEITAELAAVPRLSDKRAAAPLTTSRLGRGDAFIAIADLACGDLLLASAPT